MGLVGLPELMEILSRLEGQAVQVQAGQCTRARHRKSTCTRCADACPTGAISWEDGLVVDAEKCTRCGACAAVCPTGALAAASPSDGDLMTRVREMASEKGQVVFACPRCIEGNGDATGLVTVACLARLHEAILVGAAAFGARAVVLVDGACRECPQGKARDVAVASVGRANRLLGAFGSATRVTMQGTVPPEVLAALAQSTLGDGLSRRGFFSLLARETVRLGAVTVDTVLSSRGQAEKQEPKKGELPVALPAKRALLLAALKRLGTPPTARLDVEGWATFAHTEACTGCQMCAFFCPTGALAKAEDQGKVGVAFRASACTACGLCVDACYQNAVELAAGADVRKILDDVVEYDWMRGADEAPWQRSATDKIAKSILESLEL